MKKKLVILVVLALAMTALLCGCGSSSENADSPFVGTWTSTSYEMSGMTLDAATMGTSTLEIKANGDLTMDFMGTSGSGTWEATDTGITISDGSTSIDCTMDGENLVIDYEGVKIIFAKGTASSDTEAQS